MPAAESGHKAPTLALSFTGTCDLCQPIYVSTLFSESRLTNPERTLTSAACKRVVDVIFCSSERCGSEQTPWQCLPFPAMGASFAPRIHDLWADSLLTVRDVRAGPVLVQAGAVCLPP